jgi:hypothetical protein
VVYNNTPTSILVHKHNITINPLGRVRMIAERLACSFHRQQPLVLQVDAVRSCSSLLNFSENARKFKNYSTEQRSPFQSAKITSVLLRPSGQENMTFPTGGSGLTSWRSVLSGQERQISRPEATPFGEQTCNKMPCRGTETKRGGPTSQSA